MISSNSSQPSHRSVESLISDNIKLISSPSIFFELKGVIDNSGSNIENINEVISKDPALVAQLLKIANSAVYGFPSKVETIPQAISIVGTQQLLSLVLASTTIKQFNSVPIMDVSMENFWHHSLYCALISRSIAYNMGLVNPEQYFVMGLLHDIGKLLMYTLEPQKSCQLLNNMANSDVGRLTLEKDIFGFTHAALGAELLRQWKLPNSIVQSIANHHDLESNNGFGEGAAVVYVADGLTNAVAPFISENSQFFLEPGQAAQVLDISENELQELVAAVQARWEETLQVMYYEAA